MNALLRLADLIDACTWRLGQAVKWLALVLMLVQFAVVVMRYAYGSSFIWMQESVTYVHATLFMLAIGYAYLLDAHVRVDIFYAGWSERAKAWTDLLAVLLAVLPFCALIIWASWGYVAVSFRLSEGSMALGGLPFTPWLKSLILVMAGLLGVQATAIAIRAVGVLTGATDSVFPRRPVAAEPV